MHVFGIVAIIHAAVAAAQEVLPVQSRLRGSKTKAVLPVAANYTIAGQKQIAYDESSCSSEGITPGVCALASLARSATSKSTSSHNHVEEHNDWDGGLSKYTRAKDELERALLAEIESALAENHPGFDTSEVRQLEQELLPLFASLPHRRSLANSSGSSIGYPAARYLLHQHFVRQHSWYVRGLGPADDELELLDNLLVPPGSSFLRGYVAGHLLKIMNDKVGQQGFGLKMLAIFVATLKHLLHGDQQESLKQVWSLHGLRPEEVTDARRVSDLLEVFIARHVYSDDGYNFYSAGEGSMLSMEEAKNEVQELREIYAGWPELQAFMKSEIEKQTESKGGKFKLQDASLIADRLLEFFRKVSGSMCQDIERRISNFKGGEKGRVTLTDLRTLQSNGGNQVDESFDDLKRLGALDGSKEDDAYVFVPNYMLSPSNCDLFTSFYDLCCPDPCQMHKDHLERKLLGAEPGHSSAIDAITEVVQQRSGFKLPVDKLQTLNIIAAAHEDTIPIHSRAFAEWLREVFPRDCPRTRARDFGGEMGDLFPDSNPETSISV